MQTYGPGCKVYYCYFFLLQIVFKTFGLRGRSVRAFATGSAARHSSRPLWVHVKCHLTDSVDVSPKGWQCWYWWRGDGESSCVEFIIIIAYSTLHLLSIYYYSFHPSTAGPESNGSWDNMKEAWPSLYYHASIRDPGISSFSRCQLPS